MKKVFLIGIVLVIIFLLAVVYQFTNQRTYELNLPDINNLVEISIEQNTETVKITKMNDFEEIINVLSKIKTTKKESVQDFPINVNNEIKMDFYTKDERVSTLFIYNKKRKYYIEQPYNGIYEIDKEKHEFFTNYLN